MTVPSDRSRGCLGTLGVLVAMVAIVGGGAVAAEAVADLPDQPIPVSRGVVVQPLAGWEFVGRTEDGTGVLLTSGRASLFIETVEGSDEQAALAALQDEWSSEPTLALGPIETSDVRPGVPAARFAYSGTVDEIASSIEGEVIALRGNGYVALFDGWSGLGEYLLARDDIGMMAQMATLP
jgi:hypothetical protein